MLACGVFSWQTRTDNHSLGLGLEAKNKAGSLCCVRLERPQLLLPWVGLTILVPANFLASFYFLTHYFDLLEFALSPSLWWFQIWFHFQASLGLHLLFFNLMGALWLVAREGIPILITAYLIQVECDICICCSSWIFGAKTSKWKHAWHLVVLRIAVSNAGWKLYGDIYGDIQHQWLTQLT